MEVDTKITEMSKKVLAAMIFIAILNLANGDPNFQGSDVVQNGEAENGEKTVYACNGSPLVLRCPNSTKTRGIIKVTRANFGRFSIALCNEEGRTDWSVNCFTPKAKKAISESCDDKEDCSVSAEEFDLGPDPCPDTERYLEAHYICIQTAIARPPDIPPWLNTDGDHDDGRPSINSRRKPERRVPITAPPTKPSFQTTTYATTRFRPETPASKIRHETTFHEEAVSAAPVFYENHHLAGKVENEAGREQNMQTTRELQSTQATIEEQGSQVESSERSTALNDFENTPLNVSIKSVCTAQRLRGILWAETHVGTVSRQPCPNGVQSGQAMWECVIGRDSQPSWKNNWPDLSRCQSTWTRLLESNTEDGRTEMTETAETLARQLSTSDIYGGDLGGILSIIASTFSRIKAETDNDAVAADDRDDQFLDLLEREVVHKMANSLSWLLDRRHLSAWKDLPVRRPTLDKLVRVGIDMGDVIAKMSKRQKIEQDNKPKDGSTVEEEDNEVSSSIVTSNLHLTMQKWTFNSVKPSTSRGQGIIKTLICFKSSDSLSQYTDDDSWRAGMELRFEPPRFASNSTKPEVHPIVTVAFKNIDVISDLDSSLERSGSGSLVLAIDSPKSRKTHLPNLSQVSYTLPLATPSGVNNRCYIWSGQYWTSDGCHATQTNSSHIACTCKASSSVDSLWTRFTAMDDHGQALTEDGSDKFFHGGGIFRSAAFDDLSTSTIIIVAISASLLVASLLAAGLLIVYCRRVKIRDKKWEDRPCYLRKSTTTFEVGSIGNNDYSELGLLHHHHHQQQQQQQQLNQPHQTTLLLKGHNSPSSRHHGLGVLACIATNNHERSPLTEGQHANAHVNLLHSRSESDMENDPEVDRYHNYEVVRPPPSYTPTMTSSSTPHLLLSNTLSRPVTNFGQDPQAYSAYYRSFGRTLDSDKRGKSKFSQWIKTKLARNESCETRRQMSTRTPLRAEEFSYSGANTLRRPSDFNPASGGGSLALLLRHKNCPAEVRPFGRPFQEELDPNHRESPTLSLRSENNFFIPDQFGNARPHGRHFRPQPNFAQYTSRRPMTQQVDDPRSLKFGLNMVKSTSKEEENRSAHPPQWSTGLRNHAHSRVINGCADGSEKMKTPQQRSTCCPAILTLPPPPPPPPTSASQRIHSNRPQLYEDLEEDQQVQSPSEPWQNGLPPPWMGDAIYHLPLDNNSSLGEDWVQTQRQNLLRFSSSSSNSEDIKGMPASTKDQNHRQNRHNTTLNGTRPNTAKRNATKSGKKKTKSPILPESEIFPKPNGLQPQNIYMEVEDSGYMEDNSDFTPSSGNTMNNAKLNSGAGFVSSETDAHSPASTTSSTSSSGKHRSSSQAKPVMRSINEKRQRPAEEET